MLLLLAPTAAADTCDTYAEPRLVVVDEAPVVESSGLAPSRARPGVLYTHDDANNAPSLYAVDLDGRFLGEHPVEGLGMVDWEDLAAGPCPDDGGPCLYVGDIGDNDADRATIAVHVVSEPAAGEPARLRETWQARYPDGPRDAETLLVHPCTGEVHLVTKGQDATGTVYRWPADRSGVGELEPVADLALDDDRPITGGQWDAEGDRLVVRTHDRLFEWRTDPADPDAHWSEAPLEVGRVEEQQGEGVAYGPDGALVTSDEGNPLRLQVLACEARSPEGPTCAFVPGGGCGCASLAPPPPWLPLPLLLLLRRFPRRLRCS